MPRPDWTPLDTSKRSCALRIFTEAEEEAIANHIRINFINQHLLFTDSDFRTVCMDFYNAKIQLLDEFRTFNCSDGFISDFKRRNHFSSRRVHYKRRPSVSELAVQEWIQYVNGLMRSKNACNILNCDETSWKVFPNGLLTWACIGSEGVVVEINGDEKSCFTCLATIGANGAKLPLFFIAEGKTDRVEWSQLGNVGGNWLTHTKSGWQQEDSFVLYLMHLRENWSDDDIELILDSHISHRSEKVKQMASALKINLHYIPPGMTDLLQPLDRRVFGALKSTARSLFRKDPRENRNKQTAVRDLLQAWDRLGQDTLEEAWSCYS